MRKSGFTLIELIAVLLILAILAAALTAGLSNARNKAWRTQARETCRELCTAWNAYLLDCRKFPNNLGRASSLEAKHDNLKYISDMDENRFSRIYLELSEKEQEEGGLIDHWGRSILFSLDADYDGQVDNPFPNAFDPPIEKATATSIAWSRGDPKRDARDDNPIVVW